MKLFPRFVLLVLIMSLSLSGCSAIQKVGTTLSGIGSDNTPKPTPLATIKPELSVKRLWLVGNGDGVGKDYLKLGPTIADGRIFTADAKGAVYVTDPTTGRRIWWKNTRAPLTSGPTIGEGLVIVGTADAQVIALNENNGALAWRATVPNAILTAPQIGQGRVLVKTVDGKLCALLAMNGQLLWVYDHDAPLLVMRAGGMPQIAGNEVITGFSDGKLAAFSLNQGRLLWEQTIAAPQGASSVEQMVDIVADPIVAGNGVIYVATYQGKVAAVSLATGQILWQQDISSYTGIALGPRLLFVTDAQGFVWAFDRVDGSVVWRQTQLYNRMITAPVLMGDTLVVADMGGYLHWLSQQDGHFMARAVVSRASKFIAPPVVWGNTLYAISTNGDLSAWQVFGLA